MCPFHPQYHLQELFCSIVLIIMWYLIGFYQLFWFVSFASVSSYSLYGIACFQMPLTPSSYTQAGHNHMNDKVKIWFTKATHSRSTLILLRNLKISPGVIVCVCVCVVWSIADSCSSREVGTDILSQQERLELLSGPESRETTGGGCNKHQQLSKQTGCTLSLPEHPNSGDNRPKYYTQVKCSRQCFKLDMVFWQDPGIKPRNPRM